MTASRRFADLGHWVPPAGPPRAPARVELESVAYSYPGQESLALDDISIALAPGETIAVVGRNGSGKTTLAKLLLGLISPTDGTVHTYPDVMSDAEAATGRVSAALQDFAHYEFDVRTTVLLGRSGSDDDIWQILRAVGLEQRARQLHSGLDTELVASSLSGGEWQRLALARAFLTRDPALIVLDEPTSSLDPEAEDSMLETYAQAVRRAAGTSGVVVVVTHRLSMVRHASRVVMLKEGRIIGVGPHRELLATCDDYNEMYNAQASGYR